MPITGTGALDIASGAAVQNGGAVSVANLRFNPGTNETLTIAKPSALISRVGGFSASDTIDLKGISATTLTFLAGTLTLYDGAAAVDTLTFAGSYVQADFMIKADSGGGTDILYSGSVDAHGATVSHMEPANVLLAALEHHGQWRF